ncbi:beta-N-acetylhexosaminidase [Solemya velesiana gill symbiont]|uniref:Beta-hexosaminidase n=1 Tax=Solemya velesiana gill symbiont TaxID=1918948 RepID=A0A1T2KX02_9GAMM|nr:beta-N-acetylhexosaminidase [Solemya velesiana gill symbiont]OOZ37388.1 beta-N-acetylhexosaminidase [Solemya velesiana gill symbiont]
MSHGPLMLDLAGHHMTQEEREMLSHPATGGVILFARNYESPDQINELVSEIHALREPSLIVAVDQEGGRVQRFKEGFTRLPPAAWFGQLYNSNHLAARHYTELTGWLMASELRSVWVDFSFAPVLDLNRGVSEVIGDRAFHTQPAIVADLASAWMKGVHDAGMAAVAKHFPGHGGVTEDSHLALPVDRRRPEDVMMEDLMPFQRLIDGGVEAVMPAHVIYEKVSPDLAGFSSFWLQEVLRKRMNFQGVIFSDDLTMAAAGEAGSYAERADAALTAGCDMVLVCNNPEGAMEVLEALSDYSDPASQMRLLRMHGRKRQTKEELRLDPRWKRAIDLIAEYETSPSLDLGLE